MKDIEVSRLANKSPVDYASWLDNMFLHETTRKVNGDSTVLIDNLLFDVPSIYISIGLLYVIIQEHLKEHIFMIYPKRKKSH